MKLDLSVRNIVGTVVLVISMITGIWLTDDRYTSATELKQSEKSVYMAMEQSKQKIYLKMDMQEYRYLTEQYYKYKKLVSENPNNRELRKQLEAIERERRAVKDRIDKSLRNGG